MKYLLLILPMLLLSCCGSDDGVVRKRQHVEEQPESNLGTKIVQKRGIDDLYRYEDPELGIVCYRATSHDGIACLRKVPQQ